MNLELKPLGDIINLKRGYDLPSQKRKLGFVPIISSSGVTDFHSEPAKTGEGVVTGRYGTLGQLFYVNGDYWPLNTTLYVQDFKGNLPKFIYYFLKTLSLEKYNAASAVPGLDRNVLHKIDVNFISHLPTQRRITSILSGYDDMIDNNLKRIKLLEEKARLMFIDLINSEKTADVILGDVTEVLKRGVSPSYVEDDGIIVLNQKCIRDHLISYEPSRLTNPEKKISPERFLNKFDTLINSTGTGTLGRIAINIQDEFISTVDSHVTIVRANNQITPLYLSQCLFYFEKAIENMGKGSTNQIELSAKELGAELKIPLVKHELMVDFDNSVRPNFELIWNLQKQNIKLREARDLLLPRLMNGEIEV